MTVVFIDGPEKTGKTLLCKFLEKHYGFEYVHWGPIPHDTVYLDKLREDSKPGKLVIWDRCWMSEVVYGRLLPSSTDPARETERGNSRLVTDPWLGDWLYGRAGDRVILESDPAVLADLRDETDLPCSPTAEMNTYLAVGESLGWNILENLRTQASLEINAQIIYGLAKMSDGITQIQTTGAPEDTRLEPWLQIVGDCASPILVVGDSPSLGPIPERSGWHLPFTSNYTTRFGRVFGADAFNMCWTNASYLRKLPQETLSVIFGTRSLVIPCGQKAEEFVAKACPTVDFEGRKIDIVPVAHPAALYRWAAFKDAIPLVEDSLRTRVSKAISKHTEEVERKFTTV